MLQFAKKYISFFKRYISENFSRNVHIMAKRVKLAKKIQDVEYLQQVGVYLYFYVFMFIFTFVYMYMYIFLCLCVCMLFPSIIILEFLISHRSRNRVANVRVLLIFVDSFKHPGFYWKIHWIDSSRKSWLRDCCVPFPQHIFREV